VAASTADACRELRAANRSLTIERKAMALRIEDYALIGD
jgi:hypothetical protein